MRVHGVGFWGRLPVVGFGLIEKLEGWTVFVLSGSSFCGFCCVVWFGLSHNLKIWGFGWCGSVVGAVQFVGCSLLFSVNASIGYRHYVVAQFAFQYHVWRLLSQWWMRCHVLFAFVIWNYSYRYAVDLNWWPFSVWFVVSELLICAMKRLLLSNN